MSTARIDPLEHRAFLKSIVKRYPARHGTFSRDDIHQAGFLGLMHAAEKFDPARGYRFTTYAHYWIEQAINRAIIQQGHLVRVPDYLYPLMNRPDDELTEDEAECVRAARAALSAESGRCDPTWLGGMRDRGGDDGDGEGAWSEDDLNPSARARLRAGLAALDLLPGRERAIVRLRTGLDPRGPLDNEAIAPLVGLTPKTVQKIYHRAILEIRNLLDIPIRKPRRPGREEDAA